MTVKPEQSKLSQRTRIVLFAVLLFVILGLCAWWWLRERGVKLTPEIRWYDMWTGLYVRPHKAGEMALHLYWCPIWCIAIHFEYPFKEDTNNT